MERSEGNGRELIKLLQEVLDLNVYEAKIYLLLSIKGSLSASELSRGSGIPKSKVYEALRSLTSKGLLTTVNSSPLRYSVIPIRRGVSNRLFQLRMELVKREKRAKELVRALERFFEGDDLTAVNLNEDSFEASLSLDVMGAREEVLLAISELALELRWSFSPLYFRSSRDVVFKFLTPKIPPVVRYLIDHGFLGKVELRACDKVEQPFLVIDKRITYLLIVSPSGKASSIIRIEDEGFSRQMAFLFLKLWEKCEGEE